MIVNVWSEPLPRTDGLSAMARERGWPNVPLARHDVQVAWECREVEAPGGVMLERRLPSRHYVAAAPSFEALLDALAWEAHEWIAVEIWRAARRASLSNEGRRDGRRSCARHGP